MGDEVKEHRKDRPLLHMRNRQDCLNSNLLPKGVGC